MLAFTKLWILTTRPDRGHPKQREDEINLIWQDARGGRLRLHQWERRYGTVLQARGEALIYELAQEWTRILIPLTKLSRGSWRSFNFHMAPMKQLVTLSPSKCLVAGSRTTSFRICYRTSWVLFIRETVVCIRKSTLMGSRILLYSTAQSMESATGTLMIRKEGRRLRKLIRLLENEMNWERNDVQERTWKPIIGMTRRQRKHFTQYWYERKLD